MLVQDVFQRVAEDYAPFDVDVTTQDPGDAAIIRSDAADQVYGTRALITPSTSAINAICGGGCGGVAFLDVFDFEDATGIAPAGVGVPAGARARQREVHRRRDHPRGRPQPQPDARRHHRRWATTGPRRTAEPSSGGRSWARRTTCRSRSGASTSTPAASSAVPAATADGWQAEPRRHRHDQRERCAVPHRRGRATPSGRPAPSRTAPATSAAAPTLDYYSLGNCSGTITVTANNADVSPNLDIELQLLSPTAPCSPPTTRRLPVDYDNANGMDASVRRRTSPARPTTSGSTASARAAPLTSYNDYGSVGAYTLQVTGCGLPSVTEPSVPLNLVGDYQGGGVVESRLGRSGQQRRRRHHCGTTSTSTVRLSAP